MPVNMVIIIIFLAALTLIAIFYRNATLEKFPLSTGENILFEESGVRVKQGGSPESAILLNCKVRVTESRIIIAQKMLLSGKHALRHVIIYGGSSGSTDLKATFRKGYLNFTVSKNDILIVDDNGSTAVKIDIPPTVLTGKQFVQFRTSQKDRYMEALGR